MAELIRKDLFICHSSVDKDFAKDLGAAIEAEEWAGRNLSVFLDEWDIEPGENILLRLNDALERSRFVGLAMSPEMLVSDWCKLEYTSVLSEDPTNRKNRLLTFRYRDYHKVTGERIRIPPVLAPLNHLDFRTKKEWPRSFARLLAKLRGESPARLPANARSAFRRMPTTFRDPQLATALPEREEPDAVPEVLISNLLRVLSIPRTVWSGPTELTSKRDLPAGQHFPPCIVREGHLYTFDNLSRPQSPFTSLLSGMVRERHAIVDWRRSPVKWRWVIELLNDTLRSYLRADGIMFDRHSGRYFFRSFTGRSRFLKWGSGTRRTVAKAPPDGTNGNWVHQAAYLRFETLENQLFLSVEPCWMFTTDGLHSVSKELTGPLAMRWGGRERNGAIIRHILMWSDVLCKGRKETRIDAGDEALVLSRLPETVRTPMGLADDRVSIRALLHFTKAEQDLEPLSEELYGFVEAPEASEERPEPTAEPDGTGGPGGPP